MKNLQLCLFYLKCWAVDYISDHDPDSKQKWILVNSNFTKHKIYLFLSNAHINGY